MRPVPKTQHLLAAMIFAAVAAVYAYLAMHDSRLSDSQIYIGTAALKHHDPSLYTHDPIFGDSQLWRFHTPALQGVLDLFLIPTNYLDVTLPFRLLTALVVLVYLGGMYGLLYRQTRSWSVSVFIAILSSTVIYTFGRSYWGVGSLSSITPWSMCNALVPLVLLTFLRHLDHWPRLLLIFGLVGVMGNLHPVVSMNLTLILLIAYLGYRRFAAGAWPVAIACGLAALMGAFPYAVYYYFGLRGSIGVAGGTVSTAAVYEAFRISNLTLFYPDMLKSLLNWLLLSVVVLLVPAVVVLLRVERYRVRDMAIWVWFIIATLLISLGLHGTSQIIGSVSHGAPPVIDFIQASALIMVPLYVLLAQAVTNLFRLVPSHRNLLVLGCVALAALWMVPSDNLRVARYAVLDTATMFMSEADKPPSIQRHHEFSARTAELSAIASAANQTPVDAVYITDITEFRFLARRSVAACPDDVKYLYYLAPQRLGDWLARIARQKRLVHPANRRLNGQAVAQFVQEMQRGGDFVKAKHWYLILDAEITLDEPGKLRQITSNQWGRYYCLYRLAEGSEPDLKH